MRSNNGFTLIEVVASLVIVSIIAVFSSLFLVIGLEGYEFSRNAADAAMNAEVALSRISLELKTIDSIPAGSPPVTNTSLTYVSSDAALTGTRMIKFASGNLYISVDSVNYKLIADVSSPVLSLQLEDLDNDGTADDVAYVSVGFTLDGLPPFQTRVYPRAMIAKSW